MKREYHIIRITKSGNRIMGHTQKLRSAVKQAMQYRTACVTCGPDDSGRCEQVFSVADSALMGIPEAIRLADEYVVR